MPPQGECLKRLSRAALVLILIYGLITVARVDLEVAHTPQRSLKWLFGAEEPGLGVSRPNPELIITAGSNPENVTSTVVDSADSTQQRRDSATELVTEILLEAHAPVFAPGEELAREGIEGDEDGEQTVRNVATTGEDESIEWDPGWGDVDLDAIADAPMEAEDGENVAEEGELYSSAPIKWKYDVCLLVSMGKKVQSERPALPYAEVYRLFNAAKGAPNGSQAWSTLSERRVYVGTDFPAILCLMVRDELGPAVECSNFNRFGVRSNQCKHLVVGGTKNYSAQPSRDELLRYSFVWDTMEIVDLDVEDPARNPPMLPESEWRPTVVTAFSSNHIEVGLLMLRSLGRVAAEQTPAFEFNVSVVVWTMGELRAVARRALLCVVKELGIVYNLPIEVRRFDFDAWPSWMHLNQMLGHNAGRGEYAWKAIMIHTMLLERGFVYWADAGDRFRNSIALTQTLHHVKMRGFASRLSGGLVKDWTHVKQLEYFAANRRSITMLHNCDASGIGFTLKRYKQIARPWYECAITRQCIAPDGSSRKNHRQDQAALTLIVALSGDSCEGVDFGIAKQMDSVPNSYSLGVNATKCYRDPLNLKWH